VQGRLDRRVVDLQQQAVTVARQAERVATGQRPRGRCPRTDVAAHATQVRHATQVADNLCYLSAELHRLLDVVVLDRHGVLAGAARERELRALLALLAEMGETAPAASQQDLRRLHTHLTKALPALLMFSGPLDDVQRAAGHVLGGPGVALVAWAWQRRAILGPTTDQLVAGLPPAWHSAARVLLHAWDTAVRASSLVETWHSVLRPHLAVHRTLSPGMLALLAVYYNHKLATRGVHAGSSPLQRRGLPNAPTDWLTALGYPPAEPPAPRALPAAPSLAHAA